jgi:ATP-binding cassette subfamily F protein uup
VSSTLVLEGEGRIGEYVGGYTDWLRQRPAAQPAAPSAGKPVANVTSPSQAAAKRKLSFKDQRALERLPAHIEQLESEIAAQATAMNEPAFFQQDSIAIVQANQKLAALQAELEAAYARWAELDG